MEAARDFRELGPYLGRISRDELGPLLDDWAAEEFLVDNVAEAIRLNELSRDHYRQLGDQILQIPRAGARGALPGECRPAGGCGGARSSVGGGAWARSERRGPREGTGGQRLSPDDGWQPDRGARAGRPDARGGWARHRPDHPHQTPQPPRGRGQHRRLPRGPREPRPGEGARRSQGRLVRSVPSAAQSMHGQRPSHGTCPSVPTTRNGLSSRPRGTSSEPSRRTRRRSSLASWSSAVIGETPPTRARELLDAAAITQMVALPVLGVIDARKGRSSARSLLLRAWDLASVANEFQRLAPAAIAMAEHSWISGDTDVAVAELERIMAAGIERGFAWSPGAIAFWLWELGELTAAPAGIAEPYRLVIEGHPTEAAATWAAKGLPYERALALSHGSRLEQFAGIEAMEALGATAVAAKQRKALRDRGVVVPRGKGRETRQNAAGLTARQAESCCCSTRGSPTPGSRIACSCPRGRSRTTSPPCSTSWT